MVGDGWVYDGPSPQQQEKSPANTKSLLKRLYSLGEHPSAAKRLGAALAFNSIYTVFRSAPPPTPSCRVV